ncbi:class I SAM-dependent methyltransferase [Nitratifractor salsuginis]|uniref:Methyltransferase type 11 n=1 Tax=Nitratifractor salsuginis (strain DSM 16511 / JCM 12458 / E9I37-1) TaxID=749222 RepID=E6WY19_NITSE|nr:class I SAM-dependent methyltransferase [Nitratifractor salsuginis]ADV46393.1 Methyltransferase type 11 [Nitratifractor salsuginis DSM 16511]
MAQKDQEKWDRKYMENPRLRTPRPPAKSLERLPAHQPGLALDLACGTGRNTLALARRGWQVDAVDLSPVALQILTEQAQQSGLADRIRTSMEDLDTFSAPEEHYDLILMTNYLDRELIERIIPALKRGGIFVVETYMQHPDNEKPNGNPDYLLQPGELPRLLGIEFELLHYEEFWNEDYEMYRMRKAGVVGKKR